jgi:hypothetical protein
MASNRFTAFALPIDPAEHRRHAATMVHGHAHQLIALREVDMRLRSVRNLDEARGMVARLMNETQLAIDTAGEAPSHA